MTNPFMTPAEVHAAPGVTEHHKFPLPPEPRDYRPTYDNYGRYVLPNPEGDGAPEKPFTRVTTGAKALDDTYYVDRWSKRNVARGLKMAPELLDDVDLYASDAHEVDRDLDRLIERATVKAGGKEASELGTAIHAWAEALELGQVTFPEVPEVFQPYLMAYGEQLGRWGISAALDADGRPLVERIVYNPFTEWVGTFDRIYQLADGSLVIGDVKTAKDLAWSYLAISVQLWDYAHASLMLSTDGSRWEPMPEVRGDMAVVAWIPSNARPAKCEMISIDLEAGGLAAEAAVRVREMRAAAKTAIPNRHPIPRPEAGLPNPEGARRELVKLIRMSRTPEQMAELYEAYTAIWTEELTAEANAVLSRAAS